MFPTASVGGTPSKRGQENAIKGQEKVKAGNAGAGPGVFLRESHALSLKEAVIRAWHGSARPCCSTLGSTSTEIEFPMRSPLRVWQLQKVEESSRLGNGIPTALTGGCRSSHERPAPGQPNESSTFHSGWHRVLSILELTQPRFRCRLWLLRWGVAPEQVSGLIVVNTERDFPAVWMEAQDHRLRGGGLFVYTAPMSDLSPNRKEYPHVHKCHIRTAEILEAGPRHGSGRHIHHHLVRGDRPDRAGYSGGACPACRRGSHLHVQPFCFQISHPLPQR